MLPFSALIRNFREGGSKVGYGFHKREWIYISLCSCGFDLVRLMELAAYTVIQFI
jgi:hypothetical protein